MEEKTNSVNLRLEDYIKLYENQKILIEKTSSINTEEIREYFELIDLIGVPNLNNLAEYIKLGKGESYGVVEEVEGSRYIYKDRDFSIFRFYSTDHEIFKDITKKNKELKEKLDEQLGSQNNLYAFSSGFITASIIIGLLAFFIG